MVWCLKRDERTTNTAGYSKFSVKFKFDFTFASHASKDYNSTDFKTLANYVVNSLCFYDSILSSFKMFTKQFYVVCFRTFHSIKKNECIISPLKKWENWEEINRLTQVKVFFFRFCFYKFAIHAVRNRTKPFFFVCFLFVRKRVANTFWNHTVSQRLRHYSNDSH